MVQFVAYGGDREEECESSGEEVRRLGKRGYVWASGSGGKGAI